MQHNFKPSWLVISITSFILAACSSGGSDNDGIELGDSGIYSGTLQQDNGDVALVRSYIAANGEAVIAIEAGDSEKASHVLHGTVNSQYVFTGELADGSGSSETVSIDLTVADDQLSAVIDNSLAISGQLASLRQTPSGAASLDTISGSYARVDGGITSTLQIDSDGGYDLSGPCQSSGSVATIDSTVNLYRVVSEQACDLLGSLATIDSIEVDSDVLRVVGSQGEVDFFRL